MREATCRSVIAVVEFRGFPFIDDCFQPLPERSGHGLAAGSRTPRKKRDDPEIYVRPFPAGTPSVVISIGGGTESSWRRHGNELFYLAPNGGLMSVVLTASDVVKASGPTELLRTRVPGNSQFLGASYAATPDGRRFLVPTAVGDPPQAAVTVILNWVKAVQ